ncbi:hypothetical protein Sros01_04580 [Streptomyces roseochromogenus]|nr:hypothetical protein Sros01_04580 [Streptomyces roseochromogenus]
MNVLSDSTTTCCTYRRRRSTDRPGRAPPPRCGRIVGLLNRNRYGLRNSLWTASPAIFDRFLGAVTNGGMTKVNDTHAGTTPYAPTRGGTGLSGGPHGETYSPLLRATHLQPVSIATGLDVTDAQFAVE